MSSPEFAGRTLLLTGANGGISREVARLFFVRGGNLVLTDLANDGLATFANLLDPSGSRIATMRMDAGDPADAEAAVRLCTERFGGIDVLVPAAGIYPERLIGEISDAEWRRTIAVNLDGVFFICRQAIPHLNPGSTIINLTSIAAHRGSHAHGHYAATKGAVLSFTRSLALELAPRTRVNAVSPGIIDTPMVHALLATKAAQILEQTPMRRLGTPTEIAEAVLFFASSRSSFITGEVMHVNGGLYMN